MHQLGLSVAAIHAEITDGMFDDIGLWYLETTGRVPTKAVVHGRIDKATRYGEIERYRDMIPEAMETVRCALSIPATAEGSAI